MKKSKKHCTLYIVRHGESIANVNEITQGYFNSPLTRRGEEQAKETAEVLGGIKFDAIYSSDLDRAKRTAEIIRFDRDLKIKTSESLREKSFGIFEGKSHSEYIETLKDEFDKFDNLLSTEERWNFRGHPSMESDKELLDRFLPCVKEIALSHLGKKVLIVAHRYAIRMFLLSIGWGEHEDLRAGALKPGGYTVLESDGMSFSVSMVIGEEKPLTT